MSVFLKNALLKSCLCAFKREKTFLFALYIWKKVLAVREEERDLFHSSAVQQCMKRAGSGIILTLPLIYFIISLSVCIIMDVTCVMNSLFD